MMLRGGGDVGVCWYLHDQEEAKDRNVVTSERRGSVDLMAPVGLARQIDGSGSDGRS